MEKASISVYKQKQAKENKGKWEKKKSTTIAENLKLSDSYVTRMNTAFSKTGIYFEKTGEISDLKNPKKKDV